MSVQWIHSSQGMTEVSPMDVSVQANKGHTPNGHPGNGYPGNGHPGNGHPGNGHPGNGHLLQENGGSGQEQNGHAQLHHESYHGSTVSFHNIFYEVQMGAGCCKKRPQMILKNVSGIFKPGTMNAIIGPSGSGKSSLLDILAARKDPAGLSGNVLINGQPQPANFRLMSGYVVQDDVVMGTLSIRENLQFSADLRLPKSISAKERKDRVNSVISELSLDQCADTRVGDEFTRGVSGGERKRCNVGMELITVPGVLFLDEPTTGLDANTANSVMMLLKRLAMQGSTVIFSIHQPRYSIFKLCDSLILLGNGETLFHGPAKDGLKFFESIGYVIEEHDNPADFFLDVINGDSKLMKAPNGGLTDTDCETMIVEITPTDDKKKAIDHCAKLAQQFRSSEWASRLEEELKPYEKMLEASGKKIASQESIRALSYNSGPLSQFGTVCGRTIKNLLRNPRTSSLQIVTMCFFALITGAIYFDAPDDCASGLQNRVGAFFFMIMNMVFGNLSAIDLFINERKVFIHENISGFYRVSSYFFAKLFCDVIPNRAVPIIFFSCIVYWMIGLHSTWYNFLFFILNMIFTSLAGSSIAFVASATTRTAAIANLISALCYVFMMIFSGLLVNLDTLGEWIKWAKYLSIFSYSMKALQINEFNSVDFYISHAIPELNTTIQINCVKGNQEAYLEKQGIKYSTAWDLWVNELALGLITCGLMFITYIQLRRVKKLK